MYTEKKYISKIHPKNSSTATLYGGNTLKMRHFQVAKYDDSFVLSLCRVILDLHLQEPQKKKK